jgi:hypothetical protein
LTLVCIGDKVTLAQARLGTLLHKIFISTITKTKREDACWALSFGLFAAVSLDEVEYLWLVVDGSVSQQENAPILWRLLLIPELEQLIEWVVDFGRTVIGTESRNCLFLLLQVSIIVLDGVAVSAKPRVVCAEADDLEFAACWQTHQEEIQCFESDTHAVAATH